MKCKNLKEMKKRVLALLLCITVVMNGGISTFAEETTQTVHEHTEECKTRVRTDKLICEKPEVEEAAAHKHADDVCYEITSGEELKCGLEVTERHKHSRDVPYIKDGKDAAVSYNSADLKFKNNLDYDIKIEAKVEDRNVKIKLIRI